MVTRLLTLVLTAVLLPLGLVFTILGLRSDAVDADGFAVLGPILLGVGVAMAVAFAVLTRAERAHRRRRREGARATAQIVRAELKPYIRQGVLLTYDLTVAFPAAGTVTRRLTVVPGTTLVDGEAIDVVYDPEDPGNFEPA